MGAEKRGRGAAPTDDWKATAIHTRTVVNQIRTGPPIHI
jgi:hypothetical protein